MNLKKSIVENDHLLRTNLLRMYVLSKFVFLGAVVLEKMGVAMGIGKKTEAATVTGRRTEVVMVIGKRTGVVMIEGNLTGRKITSFS